MTHNDRGDETGRVEPAGGVERDPERLAFVGGVAGAVVGARGGPVGAGIGAAIEASAGYAIGYGFAAVASEPDDRAGRNATLADYVDRSGEQPVQIYLDDPDAESDDAESDETDGGDDDGPE